MDVELLPHVGVSSFRLGMSADEVRAIVPEWARLSGDIDAPVPGQLILSHDAFVMNFLLGFEKGVLSAVELWRFRDEAADMRVTLDGLDLFRTPKAEVRRWLEEQGHPVVFSDFGFDAVPDLALILANLSSYEYPVDRRTGRPLYFDHVRVAERIHY